MDTERQRRLARKWDVSVKDIQEVESRLRDMPMERFLDGVFGPGKAIYDAGEDLWIVADPKQAIPMKMLGFVTSSYWSGTLGQSIAMALVEDGTRLMGKTLYVPMPNETIEAEVTGTVFHDEKGERLHV